MEIFIRCKKWQNLEDMRKTNQTWYSTQVIFQSNLNYLTIRMPLKKLLIKSKQLNGKENIKKMNKGLFNMNTVRT
jgi:hypothetical protein